MDRVDSLTFSAPLFFYLVQLSITSVEQATLAMIT